MTFKGKIKTELVIQNSQNELDSENRLLLIPTHASPVQRQNLDLVISKQICKKLKGDLEIVKNTEQTSSILFSVECFNFEDFDSIGA